LEAHAKFIPTGINLKSDGNFNAVWREKKEVDFMYYNKFIKLVLYLH
jgi:hypothetical protein